MAADTNVTSGWRYRAPMPTSSDRLHERLPVLVGVGTASHRPDGDPAEGPEPIELMHDAAAAAVADTGLDVAAARSLLDRLGSVAVPVGNWSYADPARLVAQRLGARSASTIRVEIGVPQQTPVRVAAEGILEGRLDAALVVGGEAKATQQRLVRAGVTPVETEQRGAEPDEVWSPQGEFMAPAEVEAGWWNPVDQYACIEHALGHAEGRDAEQLRDDIAALWHRMNAVATSNPDAAFATPRSAEWLRTPGPDNRPLATPYLKWHSTQWAVDQAGALLLCSARRAAELGIDPARWVHPHVLVESSTACSLSRRTDLHRWPAMEVLGRAATEHVGRALSSVEHVELYSCFPSAVRVQQRELGLPLDGTPTLTGGMAFAGGPFNNFTYQATAAMVRRLRAEPGTLGMVSTVSGLLTKPGLALWSTDPHERGPRLEDLGAAAAAATPSVASTAEHHGDGLVATFTVTHEGSTPRRALVLADLPGGGRWVGASEHPDLVERAAREDIIGRRVRIDGTTCRPA